MPTAAADVLAGTDPRDAATRGAASRMVDYTRPRCRFGAARIGVVRANFGATVSAVVERALRVLEAQGAILVDPVELPNAGRYGQSELEVLLYELKADLAAYFAEFAPGSKIRTLQDLIDLNERERGREMPHFGQEYFLRAQAKGGLDSREYLDALANNHRYARAEGIDQALREHRLDALVAPTTGPAWLTDFIKGDASGWHATRGGGRYPHIMVPAGFVHGLPRAFRSSAGAGNPCRYAWPRLRQASWQRRAPAFARTVNPE
jgi:amidase